jgi:putative FmdB family regulatory protein
MPVYEYYCKHCDGIFEALRPMSAASKPAPCIQCEKAAQRIMPTSVAAFTMREGYPRKLPDKGTYWHREQEVKKKIGGKGPFRPYEHPELTPPKAKPRVSKGAMEIAREKQRLALKEVQMMQDSGVEPSPNLLPKKLRPKTN